MSGSLLQPEGRVLPTLEADGSRRWLHPKVSAGRFWNRRRATAYGLIALFHVLPFVSINGKPAVLLDIVNRQFTLFGYTFLPRDTVLLALLLVAGVLSVFFITAVFGRVWCGWGCPQTVYLEYVYRPVERLFLGRSGVGGKPSKGLASWRYVLMYAAFLLFSFHIGNLFLSYFVGVDTLWAWSQQSPLNHPTPFVIVAFVTVAMMVDFAFLREQVCSVMCPYARFQSVLLDRHSLVVKYDAARGEPRGRKGSGVKGQGSAKASLSLPVLERSALTSDPSSLTASRSADCVDCTMCVQVCPAGIDIRDGLQLECIHCAQCVDACDAVMTKLNRPTGLIRYASQAAMEGGPVKGFFRPRTVIYAAVVLGLLSLLTVLLVTKSPTDVLLVRNQGLPFVIAPDGRVENTLRVQLTNREGTEQTVQIAIAGDGAGLEIAEAGTGGDVVTLKPQEAVQKPIHVLADPKLFAGVGKKTITVRVTTTGGREIDRTFQLFGPAAVK